MMGKVIKIGITGGIGAGKSTLCRHFRDSGVPHYDSDRRAKELMTSNAGLRAKIIELFGADAYGVGGDLNREYLASEVFSDSKKRTALNGVVHPAVMRDFEAWADQQSDVPYVILESAILFDAELDSYVDSTVAVLSPEPMRLKRVIDRDGCTEDQVKARMAVQMCDDELHSRATYSVVNIFEEDLAGAAQRLDQIFKGEAIKRSQDA